MTVEPIAALRDTFLRRIDAHEVYIGIIGLGYVGLPLALTFAEKGFRVLGFDVDPEKVEALGRGECYIQHLDPVRVKRARDRSSSRRPPTSPGSPSPTRSSSACRRR